MCALIIALLDQTTTNLASEQLLIAFLFTYLLRDPVFRPEHGDGARQIVAFQGKFCLYGVFKRLREVFRRVQNTTVINVGDVDQELVVF